MKTLLEMKERALSRDTRWSPGSVRSSTSSNSLLQAHRLFKKFLANPLISSLSHTCLGSYPTFRPIGLWSLLSTTIEIAVQYLRVTNQESSTSSARLSSLSLSRCIFTLQRTKHRDAKEAIEKASLSNGSNRYNIAIKQETVGEWLITTLLLLSMRSLRRAYWKSCGGRGTTEEDQRKISELGGIIFVCFGHIEIEKCKRGKID